MRPDGALAPALRFFSLFLGTDRDLVAVDADIESSFSRPRISARIVNCRVLAHVYANGRLVAGAAVVTHGPENPASRSSTLRRTGDMPYSLFDDLGAASADGWNIGTLSGFSSGPLKIVYNSGTSAKSRYVCK